MIAKHNAFYGYVIAFAIVSSLFAKWLINEDVERREAAPHSADFFSIGYKKWQMNENGDLGSRLTAHKMTHYSDDSTTELENPLMFFERAASSQGRELIIHTANLQVLPKTNFAQTNEFTELKSGNNITTGTGMKATFSAPVHLELLAKVHGKYETK
jgi:lipopolysaccharide export system protein LptC